jgi:hypothetical protein
MRGVPWEQKTTGIKRLLVDMVNDAIALTKGFRQCGTERCAEVVINDSVLTSITTGVGVRETRLWWPWVRLGLRCSGPRNGNVL